MILMNPGPANTTQSVKDALVVEDICPREKAFGQVMENVAEGLAKLIDPSGDFSAVLFTGSGTAGVEAAISSVVPHDGRLLVLDNGAYGKRIAAMAEAYQMPFTHMEFGVGETLDLTKIEAELSQTSYTHVAVIHHETTTGMLNDVAAVGQLSHKYGAEMIVDAMSSFAAIPFSMTSLHADYLVSSSNKCIQGMAGLSFVFARTKTLESMATIPGRSLYLNLGQQYHFFKNAYQMRFTPPVQITHALNQAIIELNEEGGIEARRQRYDACFALLDAGMNELGFKRLLAEQDLSRILTAYVEPTNPNYDYDRLHDLLFERGFTIYPGKGAKVGTFRLSNMGDIKPEDMTRFIQALGEVIEEMQIRPLYPELNA